MTSFFVHSCCRGTDRGMCFTCPPPENDALDDDLPQIECSAIKIPSGSGLKYPNQNTGAGRRSWIPSSLGCMRRFMVYPLAYGCMQAVRQAEPACDKTVKRQERFERSQRMQTITQVAAERGAFGFFRYCRI